MQTQAPVRLGMPLDEFLAQSSAQPFELIDGERIDKMPTAAEHAMVIRMLLMLLYGHVIARQLGEVFAEATFILPNREDPNWVKGSRTPDLMFYSAERFATYISAEADWRARPFALVPDLVIEVISPTDTYSAVSAKVDVYLRDGVRLIWIVDPQRRKAAVHTPGQPMQQLDEGNTLSGGEIIPGFTLLLADLFKQV
mgnify:CR=1 FL=1